MMPTGFQLEGLFAPLLAAGGAGFWVELTIMAIAGLLWLVNQIFNNANKPGQPPVQQRPNAPPVPQKKQPGLDDVQEFLRRAAEQRQRPQQKEQRKQQRQQQQKKAPQQQGQRKQKAQSQPVRVEVVEDPMRERTVSAHVSKHLDSKGFGERSAHLSQVAEAPSQIGSHLQQVFDHQVGRLTRGSESDDDPATEGPLVAATPASSIAAMLANPDSARQAFILSEILRPLDERR